jgi:hypothetical protein
MKPLQPASECQLRLNQPEPTVVDDLPVSIDRQGQAPSGRDPAAGAGQLGPPWRLIPQARLADQAYGMPHLRQCIVVVMTGNREEPARSVTRRNQHERLASERERLADERERKADERERKADEREQRLADLARELGVLATGASRKALEAIDRSVTLADATRDRLTRSREALARAAASAERQQAAIDRAAARSERELARLLPDPADQQKRFLLLRKRLSATSAALAGTEEEAARIYEGLAVQRPSRGSAYQRNAEEAREVARRAHEIARELSD